MSTGPDAGQLDPNASAYRQLLQQTHADAHLRGDDLVLVADVGSVAHHVLDLVASRTRPRRTARRVAATERDVAETAAESTPV